MAPVTPEDILYKVSIPQAVSTVATITTGMVIIDLDKVSIPQAVSTVATAQHVT